MTPSPHTQIHSIYINIKKLFCLKKKIVYWLTFPSASNQQSAEESEICSSRVHLNNLTNSPCHPLHTCSDSLQFSNSCDVLIFPDVKLGMWRLCKIEIHLTFDQYCYWLAIAKFNCKWFKHISIMSLLFSVIIILCNTIILFCNRCKRVLKLVKA